MWRKGEGQNCVREAMCISVQAPPKSRKQILEEIVAKSKVLKVNIDLCTSTIALSSFALPCSSQQHERQSEKMEVEDLMEKVDADWKDVHSLLPKAVS